MPAFSSSAFATTALPALPQATATDGTMVRLLLSLSGGSMAHFTLAAGVTTKAVAHRTVEEIWYVLSGSGELWRRQGEHEEVVALAPGVCVTIPLGAAFQFRCAAGAELSFVAITSGL